MVSTAAGDYMGIVGAVVCLGGTDGCSITDGKLGAGWYFSPSLPMAYYEKVGDATDYTVELYVNYGHWLVVRDNDDTSTTAVDDDGPGQRLDLRGAQRRPRRALEPGPGPIRLPPPPA